MPKLTVASVQKITAGETRREIGDTACPGLYLIVQKSGVKSFALRFRNRARRTVKLTLGRLDVTGVETSTAPMIGMPLTLVGARHLAMDVKRSLVLGNDVQAERRREKLERKAGTVNTFSQCCIDFTEQHLRRNTRQWQRTARMLGVVEDDHGGLTLLPRGLSDRWRDRPVNSITPTDVHHVIDECTEKSVPGLERRGDGPSKTMGRAMHIVLSGLFKWLLQKRRVTSNPINGTSVPKAGKSRERTLTDAEIVAFWKATDTMSEPVGQCLKLLLLTGCRRQEIGKLRRSELSDEGGTITIPAARSKNKRPHIIPLPQLARDILGSVQTSGDFVFAGARGKPIAAWSRVKAELDAKLKFATPWVLHDLRRTTATGLSSIGVGSETVEAVLNHISGKSEVANTYNKYQHLPEKTRALQRWSEHVLRLVEGTTTDKVVALRR